MAYRSLLFVPGSRPDRFDKAAGAGADAVCIDLEDAVPPDGKDAARGAAITALDGRFGLRVNAVGTADGEGDLAALNGAKPVFVMIPKAASAADVNAVRAACDAPLWPIVESAEGLYAAWDIAAAPGVKGVLFGGADYAADLGCTMAWEPLFHARGVLTAACARAGADLIASTQRIKAMGFTGRACIHPSQIAPVHAVFTPTEAEIARARRVLDAFEAAGGGAALLDGKLIEKPLIRAAMRTLEHVGDA
jgi:citrate lyase beta subunit